MSSKNSQKIAHEIAKLADDKKARQIKILNMQEISLITDYFVICSVYSTTQAKAVADHIEEKLAEQGLSLIHKEGYQEAHWILLDYSDCIVHIFVEEDRQFYNLETLWGDAPSEVYENV